MVYINKKVLYLVLGGLILIALIIYFIFIYDFNKGGKPGTGNEQPGNETPAAVVEAPAPVIPPRTSEEQSRDQVTQLAMSFAERYGSSSNQADFSNLRDLEVFMTSDMQTRTRQYITAEQNKNVSTLDYKGVTTKAVVVTITSIKDDSAEVLVKTKRQEENAQGETKDYNQNLKLTMKKVGETWQVDTAVWQ